MQRFGSEFVPIDLFECTYNKKPEGIYDIKLKIVIIISKSLVFPGIVNLNLLFSFQIAVVEGLYFLFREMLPDLNDTSGPKTIEDSDVFEQANICWANLIHQGKVHVYFCLHNFLTQPLNTQLTYLHFNLQIRPDRACAMMHSIELKIYEGNHND